MHRVIRIRKLKTTLEILFQCLNAKSANNQLLKLKKVIEFRGKHLLCQLFELWWLIMNPFCIETLDSIYVLVNDACWFRDSFLIHHLKGGGESVQDNSRHMVCLLCLMSSETGVFAVSSVSDVICIRAWRSDSPRVQLAAQCNISPTFSNTQLSLSSSWHTKHINWKPWPYFTNLDSALSWKLVKLKFYVGTISSGRFSEERFQIFLKYQPYSKSTFTIIEDGWIHFSHYDALKCTLYVKTLN